MDHRRMCPNCRAFITTDDKVCPYCQVRLEKPAGQQRAAAEVFGGLIPQAHFTTIVILLINTGLYIATVLYSAKVNSGAFSMDLDQRVLDLFGAKDPAIYLYGEWWRLITAGFLHGGLLHILMNSWVLFDVGAQIELTFGTSRYLVIYLISNITGYLASLYWAPTVESIGASAAIMGLVGAMIAHSVRDRSSYGAAMRKMYVRWVVYILLIGLLPIFNIDNAAHIGGLIGGFAVGYAAGVPGISRITETLWRVAAGVCVAISVVAFAEMARFLITHGGLN